MIVSRRHLAPDPQARTTWGPEYGVPRDGGKWRGRCGGKMRGQSFGIVEETPVTHSATPATGKKELGGGDQGECRPIPRNSHSALITRTQRHPTVPWDAGTRHSSPLTSNPLTATHSLGDTPRVTQGHHGPRGHTTSPHSFKTPSHRDTR